MKLIVRNKSLFSYVTWCVILITINNDQDVFIVSWFADQGYWVQFLLGAPFFCPFANLDYD